MRTLAAALLSLALAGCASAKIAALETRIEALEATTWPDEGCALDDATAEEPNPVPPIPPDVSAAIDRLETEPAEPSEADSLPMTIPPEAPARAPRAGDPLRGMDL